MSADGGVLRFEDLHVGLRFTSPTRTVTESDVVMFAAMTGDWSELHTSEAFARQTQYGRRVAHGLLGLSIAHGLMWPRTNALRDIAIAFLGISDWRFRGPIFLGDTIHVRYRSRGDPRQSLATQPKPSCPSTSSSVTTQATWCSRAGRCCWCPRPGWPPRRTRLTRPTMTPARSDEMALPFDGVTILDFTQLEQGPSGTLMLADFGAGGHQDRAHRCGRGRAWPGTHLSRHELPLGCQQPKQAEPQRRPEAPVG